jgi:transcription initiation factor IIE alpha subunit
MGQQDILKVLTNKGWFSSTQIAEELQGLNISSLGDSLRRLAKGKFILVKKCDKFKHGYLYHINDGTVDENECR